MTDTKPLAPTDAEIVALADATRTAEGGANGYILPISFARAVLAKWGTPPAVAWKHDCSALLTNDVELWTNACPHCGKPRTPTQPSQPQAGAVPQRFTKAQQERLYQNRPKDVGKGISLADWRRTVTFIEAAHGIGIKGGQHGIE